LSNFTQRLTQIENEQKMQQTHHDTFGKQIESLSKSLPIIVKNAEKQQIHLFQYVNRQNQTNEEHAEEIKALIKNQAMYGHTIANIQSILNDLQSKHPEQPLILDHTEEKFKSYDSTQDSLSDNTVQETNQTESHHLDSIYGTQDLSMAMQNDQLNQTSSSNINLSLTWDAKMTTTVWHHPK
jgi:hypothetical protein